MNMAQIVLLIIGLLLFVLSFVLPEKREELDPRLKEEAEREAKRLVEEAMNEEKAKLQDSTEETVQYAIEKTERALERVSNEKVMSISEYAETVIDDINKNHNQVIFLYDMLNDKQETIKKSVSEAEGKVKQMERQLAQTAEKQQETKTEAVKEEPKKAEPKKPRTRKKVEPKPSDSTPAGGSFETLTVEQLIPQDSKVIGESKEEKEPKPEPAAPVDIPFLNDQGTETNGNNNEKILELHREGKSNMAIAKELGLGIGEVKIVIDLFEGMK